MKQNRKWLLILSIVLSVAIAAGGTMAYLQDTDEDVNVMTLGKVEIRQHEYERVQNADGTYATIETESGIGYKLKDFSQDKPLFPAVGDYRVMDDTLVYFDQLGENAGGEAGVAGQLENVQDKFVVVENTGKSDAYVRTLFAFEGTDALTEYLGLGITEDWAWNDPKLEIVVDGATYVVMEAVYVGSADRHADGILPAGEWTPSSLSQVFLAPEATNEVVEGLDTNKNGKYDILVLSQAVQVQGFEGLGADGKSDAQNALDTAFGLVNEKNSTEWFNGVYARYKQQSEEDHWDGTVDTSWYNDTDTEFVLTTAEQLAGLAELVDSGNTFEGKAIKLGTNMCFGCGQEGCSTEKNFNPIGHSSNGKSFNGTFDGQDHTLSKLYMQSNLDQNNGGWLYEGEYYGLFAYTDGATIKNVTIEDAYISSGRNEAAGVVGNAVDTAFSDITISKSTLIAYNNSAGGVAAECYGDCSFTNITVDEDTVLGPLWGTYDVRLGGIVGMVKSSDKVSFSNVDVSCKLDAINDVAANYQYWLYRYCGMLIGQVDGVNGVADPTGYVTCEDVTVTYGDWVNYHYCEFASLGAGSYNGPGEYKYARVEAGTGTDGIDLSACNHNADESHNVLIVFNQLFGGGQGVKGLETYDGVTVIDNNK